MKTAILLTALVALSACNENVRTHHSKLVDPVDKPYIEAVQAKGYSNVSLGKAIYTCRAKESGRKFIGTLAGKRIVGNVCVVLSQGLGISSRVERTSTM